MQLLIFRKSQTLKLMFLKELLVHFWKGSE